MNCCDWHGWNCGHSGGWTPGWVTFCCGACPKRTRWVKHGEPGATPEPEYPPRHDADRPCSERKCAGFSCPYCGECTATCPNMKCVRRPERVEPG